MPTRKATTDDGAAIRDVLLADAHRSIGIGTRLVAAGYPRAELDDRIARRDALEAGRAVVVDAPALAYGLHMTGVHRDVCNEVEAFGRDYIVDPDGRYAPLKD